MLGEKIARHGSKVWLINTGWTGGPYGTGSRIDIGDTRAIVHAVLDGSLDGVPRYTDEWFNLQIPERIPGVSPSIMRPRDSWQDPEGYTRQARRLAGMFTENFEKNFAQFVSPEVAAAGPRAG